MPHRKSLISQCRPEDPVPARGLTGDEGVVEGICLILKSPEYYKNQNAMRYLNKPGAISMKPIFSFTHVTWITQAV